MKILWEVLIKIWLYFRIIPNNWNWNSDSYSSNISEQHQAGEAGLILVFSPTFFFFLLWIWEHIPITVQTDTAYFILLSEYIGTERPFILKFKDIMLNIHSKSKPKWFQCSWFSLLSIIEITFNLHLISVLT